MSSLDVDSLFTNIPLSETIDICVNNVFRENNIVNGLDKDSFRNLLTLAVNESYFMFDGVIYQQIDGVAMGSPLGPILANVFLCHYETEWLENCPAEFKPVLYRRYLDDIFILSQSAENHHKFINYLNTCHENMTFCGDFEKNNQLPFLVILISRNGSNFETTIYRKPTFSGVFTNFTSYIDTSYKRGLIRTLLHRGFIICCNYEKLHQEIIYLKSIFQRNAYPLHFIDKCVRIFLDKLFVEKKLSYDVPKKVVTVILPYMGRLTLEIRTRL